ncbi:hypothetical protein STCU_10201 [Strigomonas culicis]|uniref:Uncharacterized protein n=1 Tax=Strigomonas culicis TaxID=28005 RepID=S9UU85_9TRYP|nr:hypothetical protein STCU_10201 [Strigomonas culicis]|eukprot:EPY18081.1 hypothetical protein STCU_10201 [Strigomonas culicis]
MSYFVKEMQTGTINNNNTDGHQQQSVSLPELVCMLQTILSPQIENEERRQSEYYLMQLLKRNPTAIAQLLCLTCHAHVAQHPFVLAQSNQTMLNVEDGVRHLAVVLLKKKIRYYFHYLMELEEEEGGVGAQNNNNNTIFLLQREAVKELLLLQLDGEAIKTIRNSLVSIVSQIVKMEYEAFNENKVLAGTHNNNTFFVWPQLLNFIQANSQNTDVEERRELALSLINSLTEVFCDYFFFQDDADEDDGEEGPAAAAPPATNHHVFLLTSAMQIVMGGFGDATSFRVQHTALKSIIMFAHFFAEGLRIDHTYANFKMHDTKPSVLFFYQFLESAVQRGLDMFAELCACLSNRHTSNNNRIMQNLSREELLLFGMDLLELFEMVLCEFSLQTNNALSASATGGKGASKKAKAARRKKANTTNTTMSQEDTILLTLYYYILQNLCQLLISNHTTASTNHLKLPFKLRDAINSVLCQFVDQKAKFISQQQHLFLQDPHAASAVVRLQLASGEATPTFSLLEGLIHCATALLAEDDSIAKLFDMDGTHSKTNNANFNMKNSSSEDEDEDDDDADGDAAAAKHKRSAGYSICMVGGKLLSAITLHISLKLFTPMLQAFVDTHLREDAPVETAETIKKKKAAIIALACLAEGNAAFLRKPSTLQFVIDHILNKYLCEGYILRCLQDPSPSAQAHNPLCLSQAASLTCHVVCSYLQPEIFHYHSVLFALGIPFLTLQLDHHAPTLSQIKRNMTESLILLCENSVNENIDVESLLKPHKEGASGAAEASCLLDLYIDPLMATIMTALQRLSITPADGEDAHERQQDCIRSQSYLCQLLSSIAVAYTSQSEADAGAPQRESVFSRHYAASLFTMLRGPFVASLSLLADPSAAGREGHPTTVHLLLSLRAVATSTVGYIAMAAEKTHFEPFYLFYMEQAFLNFTMIHTADPTQRQPRGAAYANEGALLKECSFSFLANMCALLKHLFSDDFIQQTLRLAVQSLEVDVDVLQPQRDANHHPHTTSSNTNAHYATFNYEENATATGAHRLHARETDGLEDDSDDADDDEAEDAEGLLPADHAQRHAGGGAPPPGSNVLRIRTADVEEKCAALFAIGTIVDELKHLPAGGAAVSFLQQPETLPTLWRTVVALLDKDFCLYSNLKCRALWALAQLVKALHGEPEVASAPHSQPGAASRQPLAEDTRNKLDFYVHDILFPTICFEEAEAEVVDTAWQCVQLLLRYFSVQAFFSYPYRLHPSAPAAEAMMQDQPPPPHRFYHLQNSSFSEVIRFLLLALFQKLPCQASAQAANHGDDDEDDEDSDEEACPVPGQRKPKKDRPTPHNLNTILLKTDKVEEAELMPSSGVHSLFFVPRWLFLVQQQQQQQHTAPANRKSKNKKRERTINYTQRYMQMHDSIAADLREAHDDGIFETICEVLEEIAKQFGKKENYAVLFPSFLHANDPHAEREVAYVCESFFQHVTSFVPLPFLSGAVLYTDMEQRPVEDVVAMMGSLALVTASVDPAVLLAPFSNKDGAEAPSAAGTDAESGEMVFENLFQAAFHTAQQLIVTSPFEESIATSNAVFLLRTLMEQSPQTYFFNQVNGNTNSLHAMNQRQSDEYYIPETFRALSIIFTPLLQQQNNRHRKDDENDALLEALSPSLFDNAFSCTCSLLYHFYCNYAETNPSHANYGFYVSQMETIILPLVLSKGIPLRMDYSENANVIRFLISLFQQKCVHLFMRTTPTGNGTVSTEGSNRDLFVLLLQCVANVLLHHKVEAELKQRLMQEGVFCFLQQQNSNNNNFNLHQFWMEAKSVLSTEQQQVLSQYNC